MGKQVRTAITPTREENYAEWYQEVIKAAELAEHAPVRGCMVIRPWGYALWERIQSILDRRFKETGHQNAYFPLFIPLSYLEKEAEHVEGFAKECAVVTHHRLEKNGEGKLIPQGELEEPLVVRPTSEMIIGEMFSRWIQSYRDLPLLINQWANVVRWEMRPRIFLRTTEFLWQEGHTAHATREEGIAESERMLTIYAQFMEEHLAIPVICGKKTPSERFPGAEETFTLEAMMQDGKALQAGTSHFLGQNFARAASITFQSEEGRDEHAWTTSWGVTTRLIGGMIMVHSDDDGLILPPKIAPLHVVILPVLHKEETKESILTFCGGLKRDLEKLSYGTSTLKIEIDTRDLRGGEKSWSWIKKGVPLRIEVGPREVEEGVVSLLKRTDGPKERQTLSRESLLSTVIQELDTIQETLYTRALDFQEEKTKRVDTLEELYAFFGEGGTGNKGGFALAHWDGDPQWEDKVQKTLGVTIRCIPFTSCEGELAGIRPLGKKDREEGVCIFSGNKSPQRVVFARAY